MTKYGGSNFSFLGDAVRFGAFMFRVVFWVLLVGWLLVLYSLYSGSINTSGLNNGNGYISMLFLYVGGAVLVIMFVGWLLWGLIGDIFGSTKRQEHDEGTEWD